MQTSFDQLHLWKRLLADISKSAILPFLHIYAVVLIFDYQTLVFAYESDKK